MKAKSKKAIVIAVAALFAVTAVGLALGFGIPALKDKLREKAVEKFLSGDTRKEILAENNKWTLSEELVMEDVSVGDMSAFWIKHKSKASEKVLLNLHGGAYIMSLENYPVTYRRMAANYALFGDVDVLTIDYRTAPDFPYPYALNDAIYAYRHLLDNGYNPGDIIIAGSSAGGGLALSLALYLKDNDMPLPLAVVTMSAWADLSKYERLSAPYVGGNDAENPYISPLYGNFSGFPKTLMQYGDEPVTDENKRLAEKAKIAGVNITATKYDDMPHVFQNLSLERPVVFAAWTEAGAFIKAL